MSTLQRRLSARILKVGESRVWLDPNKREDIEKAITAWDIRKLIKQNAIKALPPKVHKPREKIRRKKGRGKRKGKKYARFPRKRRWISTVRPLRRMLKELKDSDQLDNATYRKLYRLVKGGMFRSRSHLRIYIDQHDLLKKK